MIESALRAFCESQHRWLIVIIGTLGTGLITLLPLVDDYLGDRSKQANLLVELEKAKQDSANLMQLEERVSKLKSELTAFEGRAISKKNVISYRSRLVDIARESGCNIRRMTTGSMQHRPWRIKDDPLLKIVPTNSKKGKTGFELRSLPLSVSVSGTTNSLKSLLSKMSKEKLLMHAKNIELRAEDRLSDRAALSMELLFFDLAMDKSSAM